jgi:hypothetical protein
MISDVLISDDMMLSQSIDCPGQGHASAGRVALRRDQGDITSKADRPKGR